MVGIEPRYYQVTDKNLPTDFYSPITKKVHYFQGNMDCITYLSVSTHWHIAAGMFLTVINSEIIGL